MSSYRDVEKGEPDGENLELLEARNGGREDDGEHLKEANNIVVSDFEDPGPSSRNIANSDVKTEETNQFQEPDISEGIIVSKNINNSEESTEELKKPESDQHYSLIEAIYNYGNKELISWLEGFVVLRPCPIPILTAACQAQSTEDALRILLDAGAEPRRFGSMRITSLHAAAFVNEPESIARILGFPEGLVNEETYVYRGGFLSYDLMIEMMRIPHGYTALHVASACAHSQAVRVLLKAGANPNRRDQRDSTPLDVAGATSSNDNVQSYEETLQLLRKYGGKLSKDRSSKLVLERALRKRSLPALSQLLDAGAQFDPRNRSGYTLMHLCIELRLQEHLAVLLELHSSPGMDCRAVDVTDAQGCTVLHWAARERWLDGVTAALLARADINVENSDGDTALHLAAKAGDFEIVKLILNHDSNKLCDFLKKNAVGESPFSNAIFSGNADIVKHMCDLNHKMRRHFYTTIGDLAPLDYAAVNKYQKLFIFIFNAISRLSEDETIRILYIIAQQNLPELYLELEKNPSKIVYSLKKIIAKYSILHEAAKHSSREMIIVLLREGADLSRRNEDGQTAISLLMNNMTKPTELMTEVLDGCIHSSTDKNIYDKDCVITINYSVLKPENKHEESDNEDIDNGDLLKTKANDMKVLEAFIETGDVYDQRSLLTHPVVESFLYLKWEKCAIFIYFLIFVYVLFLISLNVYVVTIFYHMDHGIEERDIYFIFKPIIWRLITTFTCCLFCLVEILYWTPSLTKCLRKKTTWLKLVLINGGVSMIWIHKDTAELDIVRCLAVVTVSLSWIYLMILLSWTSTLGYFMQMYGKVSSNVIKVMLSFSYPLVGFSICFMILMRSKEPFDGPIAAFLKTMVMMSSEFEYENLLKKKTTVFPKNATLSPFDFLEDTTFVMLRIFFLLFLISVAIVLMNLMLGVAVTDVKELSHDGKQRRLMEQIYCLIALERLFQRKNFINVIIFVCLFKFTETYRWRVHPEVKIEPGSKIFSKDIKENILNKAQSLKENKEKKADDVGMKAKIDYMYDLTKKQADLVKELSEIRKLVKSNSEAVEKSITEAVHNILEAIANERRVQSV